MLNKKNKSQGDIAEANTIDRKGGAFWRLNISGWFPTGIYPCLSIASEQNKERSEKANKKILLQKGVKEWPYLMQDIRYTSNLS